jgi:hypothetical protein
MSSSDVLRINGGMVLKNGSENSKMVTREKIFTMLCRRP